MSKKLSILICGLEDRKQLVMNIGKILKYQGSGEIEILASIDNGEVSIGKKRNDLLNQSSGEYICFVDDDDMISPFYVSKILEATKDDSDCIGLEGIIVSRDGNPKKFIHSIKYTDWYEKDNIYYRCPNHLNPVKRNIALKIGFPEIYYHEDVNYSMRLKDHLKTETYIDDPIYFYYPNN